MSVGEWLMLFLMAQVFTDVLLCVRISLLERTVTKLQSEIDAVPVAPERSASNGKTRTMWDKR